MKITLLKLLIAVALIATLIIANHKKDEPIAKPAVDAWSSSRYHFVQMLSMTEERYTMICDRHTGMESLLAKGYKRDRKTGDEVLIAMAQVGMGFNPNCLGRDIQAYQRRGRPE